MDMRGGCCIARYQNGNIYDMSKVDRIMLKFRPIAPKPAAGAAVSSGSPAKSTEHASSKTVRGKRKYNKENNIKKKNNNKNRKIKAESEESNLTRKTSSRESVVTLPLLRETPERKESPVKEKSKSPIWFSFGNEVNFEPLDGGHVEPTAVMSSIVTVECMTDMWLHGNMLGNNDKEKMMNLGKDTCPGFISDGGDRVAWTNKAYGEMVGSEEAIVWLAMKERAPIGWDTFSCMVRVQSTCRGVMTLPCDVWRMDGGGFAWRLDVEAALSLGR